MPDYSHLQPIIEPRANWLVFEGGPFRFVQAAWTLYVGEAEIEIEFHQTIGRNLMGDERGRTYSADYMHPEEETSQTRTPNFPFKPVDAMLSRYAPNPLDLPLALDDFRTYIEAWADTLEEALRSWTETGLSVDSLDETRRDLLTSMRYEVGDEVSDYY